MKKISILGSTGSIGENALDVIEKNSSLFCVASLAVNRSIDKLAHQIEKFSPSQVCIFDEASYNEFNKKYSFENVEVLSGMKGLIALAKSDCDIVLTSLVGSIGLEPTVTAIENDKIVALANKETMVLGGDLINSLLVKHPKSSILPVDSEHSAIAQCIEAANGNDVSKILLTASGGPFFDKPAEEFSEITPEQAVKHPKWDMGRKISIDSATMMNKGLEVIEAHYLFGIDYENIVPVVHKQSIVHSMIEFNDGVIMAQMGAPDMRAPIAYAFSYPTRLTGDVHKIDLTDIASLTFEKVNLEKFKCLDLAIKAGKKGHGAPGVLNAANEIAVDAFLNNQIKFTDIADTIEYSMEKFTDDVDLYCIDSLLKSDSVARDLAREYIKTLGA